MHQIHINWDEKRVELQTISREQFVTENMRAHRHSGVLAIRSIHYVRDEAFLTETYHKLPPNVIWMGDRWDPIKEFLKLREHVDFEGQFQKLVPQTLQTIQDDIHVLYLLGSIQQATTKQHRSVFLSMKAVEKKLFAAQLRTLKIKYLL